MAKTIVILGGGVGGQVAANDLRGRLSREHRIVLVEKIARHAYAPSFLWLMTGDRQPEQVTRDVRDLLRPGIDMVEAEVRAIDVKARRVETSAQSLVFDYLVIALGAELAPDTIPGLAESAHSFYTLDGAVRLRSALDAFTGGTIALVVGALPYKCPGAPHEGAMLLADFFRRRGLRDKVEIHLLTPESQPMPVAGPGLGDAVRRMLEDRGVRFHPLHKLTAVEPDGRQLHFEGKSPVGYDLLVAIPPHRAPALVRNAGLTNEAGWIPVDPRTLATRHERVYALGDVTAIPIPGRWKADVPLMLPKAGVFAHAQALVVAHRIATEMAGLEVTETFRGHGFCMLEAGKHAAGLAYGDFYAEPSPRVEVRNVGRSWHLGKVLFEQWWLARGGVRGAMLQWALKIGSRVTGVPVEL
jgi:sulfide:quinone oxidoreductase